MLVPYTLLPTHSPLDSVEKRMDDLQPVREHVVALLKGGMAFDTLEEILSEFPPELRGVVPEGAERSAWQILEHMRLSLRDLVDYCRNEDGSYAEKDWPEGYWPKDPNPPTPKSWADVTKYYLEDLAIMERLVESGDLLAPFPWHKEHTLLREALIAAEHAAYHLGELVMLRRFLSVKC